MSPEKLSIEQKNTEFIAKITQIVERHNAGDEKTYLFNGKTGDFIDGIVAVTKQYYKTKVGC